MIILMEIVNNMEHITATEYGKKWEAGVKANSAKKAKRWMIWDEFVSDILKLMLVFTMLHVLIRFYMR